MQRGKKEEEGHTIGKDARFGGKVALYRSCSLEVGSKAGQLVGVQRGKLLAHGLNKVCKARRWMRGRRMNVTTGLSCRSFCKVGTVTQPLLTCLTQWW